MFFLKSSFCILLAGPDSGKDSLGELPVYFWSVLSTRRGNVETIYEKKGEDAVRTAQWKTGMSGLREQ
jgi:hypothetical protein